MFRSLRLSFDGCVSIDEWKQPRRECGKSSSPGVTFNVPSKAFLPQYVCCLILMQGIDKLRNWPNVLLDFRKVLSKAKKTVPLSRDPVDSSAAFRLLRLIAQNRNTKSYTAIESNFLFAALHLACMRDICLSDDACPDLPDNIFAMVKE